MHKNPTDLQWFACASIQKHKIWTKNQFFKVTSCYNSNNKTSQICKVKPNPRTKLDVRLVHLTSNFVRGFGLTLHIFSVIIGITYQTDASFSVITTTKGHVCFRFVKIPS